MCQLRAHPIIGTRDYYYSYVIYQEELKEARGAGYFDRLWDCFAVPRIRRANYGASTVMLAQQMCGINSKSPTTTRGAILTRPSHLVLQLQYLYQSGLQRRPGLVRFLGLWCHSGRFHYPDLVPDRYQGSPNFDPSCKFCFKPEQGERILTHCPYRPSP